MVFFGKTAKTAKKGTAKTAKCPTCKKSLLTCPGHYATTGEKIKEKVKVEGKDGRTRTVTRNTGHTVRDGIVWCGICSCRRINDRCTNAGCSSNAASA